jgi:leucyl/phenylalanyl-tRNA--protein transferase
MSTARPPTPQLTWLESGQDFPPVSEAWGHDSPAPGLLAAGGSLDVPTLIKAYCRGIFPWFSEGQPVLWWSTDPRMVLDTQAFRFHRSLKKSLRSLLHAERLEIRMDSDFQRVIQACASTPRAGQKGTWITAPMVEAYIRLHQADLAHSVEAWIDGELAGGLYLVNLGGMVFGESMFAWRTDASKLALAALVAFCRAHGMRMIDCQQETSHLASMGARAIARERFIHHVQQGLPKPSPVWRFSPLYWTELNLDPSLP